MDLSRRLIATALVIFIVFLTMLPILAETPMELIDENESVESMLLYNFEYQDDLVQKAVQTSDYTFIINAILLIIASVAFILIRIKRRNKNQK